MNIVTDLNEWCEIRKKIQAKSIGFVPTMGNLHQGHLSLCERAISENDVSVVSIFVNPTQFNQTEDFINYPRTLEQDEKLLLSKKVNYLLLPEPKNIYFDNYEVQVNEIKLSKELEGLHRPGHFNGMLTVILKLLNLTQATRAYFGEKDYQQLLLIKKMAKAFFMPVEIIAGKIVRAEDGLALSSRNSRLSKEGREKAAKFPASLKNYEETEKVVTTLEQEGFKVDYVENKWGRRLAAVWLDGIRLIDNVVVEE